MDYRRRSVMVPVTCTYWRNATCYKGDRCTFVHGFICRDDGICSDGSCNKAHFKQRDPSTYMKGRGRNNTRSRYRSRSRSPYRRSKSPYSPRRRPGSPRRRSNTPRKSYSPRRSRTRSHTRSLSRIRSHSRSLTPRRDYSPYKKERRSMSRSYSRSPLMDGKSPDRRKSSSSRGSSPSHSQRSDGNTSPLKERNSANFSKNEKNDDVLILKTNDDMFYDPYKEKEDSSDKFNKSKFKPIGEMERETKDNDAFQSPMGEMSPSSKALEILKTLPKDFFNSVPSEEKKDRKEEDEKDKQNSKSDQESFREAFLKALNESAQQSGSGANKGTREEGEDKLPPVLKLPLNAESLAKPFQEKLYGLDQEVNSNLGPGLWTPALDRAKPAIGKAMLGAQQVSNWEIDTPYVGRNSRGSSKDVPAPMLKNAMPPPPPLPAVEEPKKKKKRRRRTSSSSSSSSSSEEEAKTSETAETALERKKKILSKVWTLMAQKKKLEAQRDETVLNHKGDGKSLAVLLKENSTLSSEIDKQIFLMNQMVQSINERLGMSKTEAQQQEFFFQPSMYKDSKSLQQLHSKKNMTDKVLKKSISKFLKPSEEAPKRHSSPPPNAQRSKKPTKLQSRSRSRSKSAEKKLSKKHEKKVKKEKSPLMEEVKHKKKKELKKQSGGVVKVKVQQKEEEEGGSEYAPSPAMKPHVKYIDQGMHWCKICNDFLDSVEDYVNHLESGSHLEKVKEDPKLWLPKFPKIEKDPVNPNAPVLTIPLQGMEFIHSITSYFCSLCNTFMKTKDEAKVHAETKLHVSKYKDYLSKNPMYEVSYVKDKMAAFAKYSVEIERRKDKNSSLDRSKSQDFFGEVKNKTDEDIGRKPPNILGGEESYVKFDYREEASRESMGEYLGSSEALGREGSSIGSREEEEEHYESSFNRENSTENTQEMQMRNNFLAQQNYNSNVSSIRVASRVSSSGNPHIEERCSRDTNDRAYSSSPKNSYSIAENTKENSIRKKGTFRDEEKRALSIEEEEKLHALKRRVAEFKGAPDSSLKYSPVSESRSSPKLRAENVGTKSRGSPLESSKGSIIKSSNKEQAEHPHQQQQSGTSKLQIKTFSNVIIGKMPFLKRSKQTVKTAEVSKPQESECSSSVSEAEERIRQMVTEGFPSLTQRASDNKEPEPLPPSVPRNTEYITEIESCDDGTTFTKKFGPTLKPEDYSDEDSKEAPMDLSSDEDSDKEKIVLHDNSQSLMSIPVPVDPMKDMEWRTVSPVENTLNVDLSSPHLSQLSAAAAMYKEAVSYQPLPMPPTPFMQMPPIPAPMMNPPLYPPYNPQPPPSYPDDYMEGANPPPPGTEEGSSNHSSGNQQSDGADSPDSFLCQKTPPPPGTEDESLKMSKYSNPTKSSSNKDKNSEDNSIFKEMLSDLPVLSHNDNLSKPVKEKDEGSQESLVQEGLELLEFADEDGDGDEDEKTHRNISPPPIPL